MWLDYSRNLSNATFMEMNHVPHVPRVYTHVRTHVWYLSKGSIGSDLRESQTYRAISIRIVRRASVRFQKAITSRTPSPINASIRRHEINFVDNNVCRVRWLFLYCWYEIDLSAARETLSHLIVSSVRIDLILAYKGPLLRFLSYVQTFLKLSIYSQVVGFFWKPR